MSLKQFPVAWGTGLGRIRNACKEYELPQPLIEEDGNGFRVTFYRKKESTEEMAEKSGNLALSGTIRQSGSATLLTQDEIVIHYVRKNGECTAKGIADLLNVKGRRARDILGNFVKKGVLEKKGSARNTVYCAGQNFPSD